jgi:hypothetical protein
VFGLENENKQGMHDVNLSLCNVDEKEHVVCCHGEKLATAFSLVKRCPGSTVPMIVNLRICRDFPTATKFIRKIVWQEMQLRNVTASSMRIVCIPVVITADKSLMSEE